MSKPLKHGNRVYIVWVDADGLPDIKTATVERQVTSTDPNANWWVRLSPRQCVDLPAAEIYHTPDDVRIAAMKQCAARIEQLMKAAEKAKAFTG